MLRTTLLLASLALGAQVGVAQDLAMAQRPRFLTSAPGTTRTVEIDPAAAPVLQRRVTLTPAQATLGDALAEVSRQAGIRLVYSRDVVDPVAAVRIKVEGITVAAVLTELLLGRGVDIVLSGENRITLAPRPIPPRFGNLVGRVTDAKTGEGLSGVEILLEKSAWRTATDSSGWYRLLEIGAGNYTLAVRRLGYAMHRQQITIPEDETDTVNAVLEPQPTRLTELVSTATGKRRRMDIANDVTTINADSVLQTAPIASVTDLLETRVPGLTTQRTTGAPGDPTRLRLRGPGSALRNNDPIVIVDGIRIYAEQSAERSANLALRENAARLGHSGTVSSPLESIDPNSIETIEVLKGPSAATLYGQDAANGVIVITTKKGRPGPVQWTASAQHGQTKIAGDYPDLYYRWGHETLYGGALVLCPATNMVTSGDNLSGIPCQGDSLLTFQLLNEPDLTVLDLGHFNQLSLSASGGSGALTYSVTTSYRDEVGLVKLPDYEVDRYQAQLDLTPPDWMRRPQHFARWSVGSNITAQLGEKSDLTFFSSLARTEQQKSSLQDQLGSLMSTYIDRSSGLYYRGSSSGSDLPFVVPVLLSDYYERSTSNQTVFRNGLTFRYQPNSWSTLTAQTGLDVLQRAEELYFPRGPANGSVIDTLGFVNRGQGTSIVGTVNLRGNARRSIGRGFALQFAMGVNYVGTSINDVAIGTSELGPGASLKGAKTDYADSRETSDATFGWYMEPSVGNSKLNFSSGLRIDGGKTYGSGVSGLSLPRFPKLGFAYTISEESWFPRPDWMTFLRLRVAYGKSSRQPGPTDRLRLYSTPSQVFADGQSVTGIRLTSIGNTELRPERSAEIEGGIDVDLFAGRLGWSITGIRKTTDDALMPFPLPTSVYGERTIVRNVGVIRNTSLEMSLTSSLVRTKSLVWAANMQLSRRRDDVVSLGPGVEPYYLTPPGPSSSGGGVRVAAGYPLFGRWSRPIAGYADANGDGAISRDEVQLGDTAVYVGSTLPNFTMAFGTTVSLWHGVLVLDARFSYEDGLAQRNNVAQRLGILSRGRMDPTSSLAEQVGTINLASGAQSTDYNWIQTVNTTRFQSFGVTYAVPPVVARRVGARRLSVALSGSNLGLWTNYRGLDPNVNAFGTGNGVTDTGILPEPRMWQLRVSATY